MKPAYLITLFFAILIFPVNALEIKKGTNIDEARKAMKLAGYTVNGNYKLPDDPDYRIDSWKVDDGSVSAHYSTSKNNISYINYSLRDPNKKELIIIYNMELEVFNTTTKKMIVQLEQPTKRQSITELLKTIPEIESKIKKENKSQ
jgi:hypothetical protein